MGDLVGQADLLLCCRKCMWRQTYELEVVIERLVRRGVNGRTLGICAAARHVRICCERCGQRTWETRPAYINRLPPGIPGPKSFSSVCSSS